MDQKVIDINIILSVNKDFTSVDFILARKGYIFFNIVSRMISTVIKGVSIITLLLLIGYGAIYLTFRQSYLT